MLESREVDTKSKWIPILSHLLLNFFTPIETQTEKFLQIYKLFLYPDQAMKHPIVSGEDPATGDGKKMQKIKLQEEQQVPATEGMESVLLEENLLYEVLIKPEFPAQSSGGSYKGLNMQWVYQLTQVAEGLMAKICMLNQILDYPDSVGHMFSEAFWKASVFPNLPKICVLVA